MSALIQTAVKALIEVNVAVQSTEHKLKQSEVTAMNYHHAQSSPLTSGYGLPVDP